MPTALFAGVAALLMSCQVDDRGLGSWPAVQTGARAASAPAFLLHSAIEIMERRTNYLTLVRSLREVRKLDYGEALELPGRARLYAGPGTGFFAVGDRETAVITRYQMTADGRVAKGRAMSLQAHGVSALGAQSVLFISPTKAYYKDPGRAQVLVWNPDDMKVERTIPLPADLMVADHLTSFSQWASRPGQAFFAVSWTTGQHDRVRPGTALVQIDTATDAVTVGHDARCRGLDKTGRLGGVLYFFSDVINAFGHALSSDDAGQPDCILRVSPGRTTFDPDYVGSVASAFPGSRIGTVAAVTETGRAWVQLRDASVGASAPGSTHVDWYARGWTWAHLDLATLSDATRIPGEPGAYTGTAFLAGADFFIGRTAPDHSETTLLNLSGTSPRPALSFPGFAVEVAQLQ
jgi:hypothetical protein